MATGTTLSLAAAGGVRAGTVAALPFVDPDKETPRS
jgi:hypothetical protein